MKRRENVKRNLKSKEYSLKFKLLELFNLIFQKSNNGQLNNNNNNNSTAELNGMETEKPTIIEKPEVPPLERLHSNSSLMKPARAKSNWLKVGAAAAQRKSIDSKNSFMLTDMINTPESPTASVFASRRSSASAWENTIAIVASPATSKLLLKIVDIFFIKMI